MTNCFDTYDTDAVKEGLLLSLINGSNNDECNAGLITVT